MNRAQSSRLAPVVVGGLAPAWQQTMQIERFRVGEVNRATEVHWRASGKVVNVGLTVHRMGGASLTVAPSGGTHGRNIEREFEAENASACWVSVRRSTRVCSTVADRSSGVATELVENAPFLEADELTAFRDLFRAKTSSASIAIFTGSLPSGVPASWIAELLEELPCRLLLDVSGEALLASLSVRPWLVKPNRLELERTMRRRLETDTEVLSAMRDLNAAGAKWVLVTQGPDAVWLTSASETWRIVPPVITTTNTIGCGDCLAGGLAWALQRGCELSEAAGWGVAAGVAKASALLPACIDLAMVERVKERVEVERM